MIMGKREASERQQESSNIAGCSQAPLAFIIESAGRRARWQAVARATDQKSTKQNRVS